MSDRGLKVTDKRMFTADGELREEFVRRQESLNENRADSKEGAPSAPTAAPVEPALAPPVESPTASEAPEGDPDAPSFTDLVRLLAENASIYLSESQSGDPQTAQQHLDLARLHIDMLGILQDKTRGNLTTDEHAMLENVVYQLRSGFVGLGG